MIPEKSILTPFYCNKPESNIPSAILVICGVGGKHWSGIIKHQLCVVLVEIKMQHASMKLSIIQKLEFNFDGLKAMVNINATKTVMEILGQVTSQNNCDDKVTSHP